MIGKRVGKQYLLQISCNITFISASRCVSCTSSQPANDSLRWSCSGRRAGRNNRQSVLQSVRRRSLPQSYRNGIIASFYQQRQGQTRHNVNENSREKHTPLQDFFSFVYFSSKTSNRPPKTPSLAEWHSSPWILEILFFCSQCCNLCPSPMSWSVIFQNACAAAADSGAAAGRLCRIPRAARSGRCAPCS